MWEYAGITGAYILGWYAYYKSKKRHDPSLCLLAFHDVSDKLDLSITRLSVSRFKEIITYLSATGRQGVSIGGLVNEKDIALTFDDGWRSFYRQAFPVLRKFGFSATVFLVSGYVGRKSSWDYQQKEHLTWNELKELSRQGIEIGSHSVSHTDLRHLDQARLEYEISGSRKMLEDKLGVKVRYFSYPFGRYDKRVIDAVKAAGYENAFSLADGSGDFAVARRGVYMYDTPYSVSLKIDKKVWTEYCKDYINNSLAGGTIILRRLFPAVKGVKK